MSQSLHAAGNARWMVLHTRSRQEKWVAAYLAERGISHYLPLLPQVRYYGRRAQHVDLPLFPGYVFLHGQLEDAYLVDRTRRLAGILPATDQGRLDWELSNIRFAIEQQATLQPYPALRAGARARVRSGPMQGLEGLIEKRLEQTTRLVLQVDMLGQAVSVEVDASLLDVIEEAPVGG